MAQDKVASSQGGTSPSKANAQQSIELAEMQQGLQKSNAALQDAQSQLYARQEHVQELTQRLEAAQAEVASLQVSGLFYTLVDSNLGPSDGRNGVNCIFQITFAYRKLGPAKAENDLTKCYLNIEDYCGHGMSTSSRQNLCMQCEAIGLGMS